MNVNRLEVILQDLRDAANDERLKQYNTVDGIRQQILEKLIDYRERGETHAMVRYYDDESKGIRSYTINLKDFA